ncbi:MAG: hypothetical protein NVS2B7_29890 [Herpetosiphon sp.]
MGAHVTTVSASGEQSSVYGAPVTLQQGVAVNKNDGPEATNDPPTNPPSATDPIFSVGSETLDDSVVLAVTVTPLRYDPATKQATLIQHVDLQISYDAPASTVAVSDIVINNGAAVTVEQTPLPLNFTITSSAAQAQHVTYRVLDADGSVLRTGAMDVALQPGGNPFSVQTDSVGWHPGPMLVELAVDGGGSIADSAASRFVVRGRSIDVTTDAAHYELQGTATVSVSVYDEAGAAVTGLSGDLRASVDGTSVQLNWSAGAAGGYQAALALGSVRAGGHVVTVQLAGAADGETGFTLGTPAREIYLAAVTR